MRSAQEPHGATSWGCQRRAQRKRPTQQARRAPAQPAAAQGACIPCLCNTGEIQTTQTAQTAKPPRPLHPARKARSANACPPRPAALEDTCTSHRSSARSARSAPSSPSGLATARRAHTAPRCKTSDDIAMERVCRAKHAGMQSHTLMTGTARSSRGPSTGPAQRARLAACAAARGAAGQVQHRHPHAASCIFAGD